MYSTPYVPLYIFRNKPVPVSQSSHLTNDSSDSNEDAAFTETVSQLRRQRYDGKLNYDLF
jgi:hypothetical protein